LQGELGDLLLQVVYHARIAEEAGLFGLDDIARAVGDKMVARHPHVFGTAEIADATRQTEHWEALKAAERSRHGARTLDGVARSLPALLRAVKLQKRAARVGFDWPEDAGVLDKIAEETGELAEARARGDTGHMAEEFGDLLFAMANLARRWDIDPEAALRAANAKFIRRFEAIEDALAARGTTPANSTLDEMEAEWQAAKAAEKPIP
jgi:ATP diphosphatase